MWRSKPSQTTTWITRYDKTKWLRSLCKRILNPSDQKSFEKQLAALLGTNHSPPSMLAKQDEYFSEILKDTSQYDSYESSPIWEHWVMGLRLAYSQRRRLAKLSRKKGRPWVTPSTVDIERTPEGVKKRAAYRKSIGREYVEGCLTEQVQMDNWATPCAMNTLPSRSYEAMVRNAEGPRKGRTAPSNLHEQVDPLMCKAYQDVKKENWPTPKELDSRKQRELTNGKNVSYKTGTTFGTFLCQKVLDKGLWPTPRSNEVHALRKTEMHGKKKVSTLSIVALPETFQNNEELKKTPYKLSPNWVEQLMGLPVGWTNLG